MKADIQSQIEYLNDLIANFGDDEKRRHWERRKSFLNHVLNAPIPEINQKTIGFVYD